jgi:putative pyoverdin transport system ATP-binding/permease protein
MNLVQLLLRSSRRTVVLAVAAGLAGGACSVGLIALIQVALGSDGPSAGRLVWGFAGLCLAVLLTRAASQALLIRLAQESVSQLYEHLSREILAVPLREFEKVGSHRLLAVLTEDVPAIAGALVGVPIVGVNAAILLCCLLYLGWLSPLLLIGVLGFLVVGVLTYLMLVRKALGQLHLARREHDTLMHHFRGLTEGFKELKMHSGRREEFLREFLGRTAAGLRDRNTAGLTFYAAAGTWGQLLFFICIGLLLFALRTPEYASRAVVSGYVLTVLYAVAPVETIMTWLPILGRARVALRAVEDLDLRLATGACEPGDEAAGPSPAPPFEQVELAGVTYAYRGGAEDGFVLGPVDLTLRRGELVFVAGGNGSGKTTLAKLLVGLYAPASGEVLLNRRAVGDRDRAHYRQLFSVLFTGGYIFDHLLGTGIVQPDARVRQYLSRLELGHKVRIEGDKFSTTELSQGQRKRLALLAAYLEDRPVYIFDEWASHQDPRFKEVFYTRLLPELKARGKAVLVISHDDRYFHVADRVVKFDSGMLEEVRLDHDRIDREGTLAGVR